ncbi:hypothetical protein CVT24_001536 [Panaeolus cyanescens]|uniref:Transmembrane protein n=1 Tax=Panaeolus cyanescens TaxID=181874 RepID=A0A409YYT8_9AGAR|nr:hypothetical protein CVT24_001536 [Panaeolus cyanescens]
MLRTGCLGRILTTLLLWVGSGAAQSLSQTLPSTPTISVPTNTIGGVSTSTTSTLSAKPSPTSVTSVGNSTSSVLTTSTSPIPSGLDDPATHLHSSVPLIAGSLAAFMVILAAVLVAIVVGKRKRRRRRSHALSARFNANVHDRSIPSRRSSGRHDFMRQSIDSPRASIDLPARGSKKSGPFAHFNDDLEAGGTRGVPRIVVTEDNIRSRSRHSHQHSRSSASAASTPSLATSSPATLSSHHSADVKHPNILTDQTPALQSSAHISDSRSRSVSPSPSPVPRTPSAAGSAPPDTHPQLLSQPNSNTHPSSAVSSQTHLPVPAETFPPPQSSALLTPTLRRDNLIALLQQQQEILLLSGCRDSRTVGAVALLQEQITMLRRHQQQEEVILGLRTAEAPPAYEDSVRS